MEPGFFTPIAAMDESVGFSIGSPLHLAYLAYSFALIAVVVLVYRHLRGGTALRDPRRTMMLVVAFLACGLKGSEVGIMIATGVYNVFWWPLHPCNICVFLLVVYALAPNAFSGEVLYALGIPGGLCGILFADWIKRSIPLNWFCWCGFTEHALLIAFPIMLIAAHDFRPRLQRIWQPMLFVCVGTPVFRAFNARHGTNYWFVSRPSPGSPLVPLAEAWGNPGYLFPLALALFGLWFVMYLPCYLRDRRAGRGRHSKKTTRATA
ncbi:MAG: YwaF family protein [Coriobacteriales bacterium]